jgi:hypothetical protein
MTRLGAALLGVALMATGALAQSSQLERARFLLAVGDPEPALAILEALPETPAVVQGRAQAHLMIASQRPPGWACEHLRRAIDLGSLASAGGIVEFARKRFQDDGCQISQPGS